MACWRTKAAISVKRVKIEEKLLWTAYRNSPTLFRTVPSEQKPIKFVKSSCGRSQKVSKIFRAPIYRAHCAVIFAIAQLSCSLMYQVFAFHGPARSTTRHTTRRRENSGFSGERASERGDVSVTHTDARCSVTGRWLDDA